MGRVQEGAWRDAKKASLKTDRIYPYGVRSDRPTDGITVRNTWCTREQETANLGVR